MVPAWPVPSSCPGSAGRSLGGGACCFQPGALCLALLCLRWYPEPGPGSETCHSERSPTPCGRSLGGVPTMPSASQPGAVPAGHPGWRRVPASLHTLRSWESSQPCSPLPPSVVARVPHCLTPWEMCPVHSLPQGAPSLPHCPMPAWSCSRCHSTACCELVPRVTNVGDGTGGFACVRQHRLRSCWLLKGAEHPGCLSVPMQCHPPA